MKIQDMYEGERKSVISVNIKAYIPNSYAFYDSKKIRKRSGFEISIIFKIKGSTFTAVIFHAKLHFKFLLLSNFQLYCFLTIFIYIYIFCNIL